MVSKLPLIAQVLATAVLALVIAVTYPGGKTRNTTLSGQRTGKGEFSGTANVTGRNGRTRSGTFVRTR
jgi:hypothetical protein